MSDKIVAPDRSDSEDFSAPSSVDVVVCPDVEWNGDADPAAVLKPAFDMIWNACGYPRCMYYDRNGIYQEALFPQSM